MHIEKYGIAQVKKLYQHYLREHITDNVITERTKENIILENKLLTQYLQDNNFERNSKNIDNYFSEYINTKVKRKIRADSVVMCDLIITQPKEMGTECNQDFFEKCIDTFSKKYCKQDNVVSAVVHNDEQGQPHCHITFIPITEDGRLSAKDYIGIRPNKKGIEPIINLNNFHKEMERLTGYTLTSEDKTKKDLTMKEYQEQQEIKKQKEKINLLEAEKENNKTIINDLQKNIDAAKEKIKKLENEKEKVDTDLSKKTKAHINLLENKIKEKNDGIIEWKDCEIKEIEMQKLPPPPTKKDMFGKEKIDTEKINDYVKQIQDKCNEIWYANTYNLMSIKNKDDMLNYKAKEYINIDKQINELSTRNIKLKSENELLKGKSQNYDILQSQYHELSKENQIIKSLLKESDLLDKIMDVVQKVLHPPKSQNRGLSL